MKGAVLGRDVGLDTTSVLLPGNRCSDSIAESGGRSELEGLSLKLGPASAVEGRDDSFHPSIVSFVDSATAAA